MIGWLLILGGIGGMVVSYVSNENSRSGRNWVLIVSWLLVFSGIWIIVT